MTQSIDYNAITDRIVTILQQANTTTAAYDLSMNLTKRVQNISRDDFYVVPKFKALYPAISVALDSKRERMVDWNINRRGREVELVYSVVCVLEKFKNAEKETWDLVRNIDAILRENINMGYTTDAQALMLWSTGASFSIEFMGAGIQNYLFSALISNESAFTKASQVNVTVKCYLDGGR